MRAPALRILLPLAAVVVVLVVVAMQDSTPEIVDESTRGPGAGDGALVPPPAPVPPGPELVDSIERAIADVGEDATAEQIDLLVRGLMSDDEELALRCAAVLDWDWLSGAEMKRAVALLWPALTFEEHPLVDFEELRSMAGSSELPAMLRTLPKFTDRGNAEYVLANFHRLVRTDHLPQIAALAVSPDPLVRAAIFEDLAIPLEYTDRHREAVARALLELMPPPGGETSPPTETDGWPPLLVRVLERFVLGETEDFFSGTIHDWAIRWAYDATPSDADAALLIRLARHESARSLALRAMRHLSDPATERVLREASEDLALGSLATRGDADARRRLERRAQSDSESLALLLEAAPEAGRAWLAERLFRSTDAVALETAFALDGAREEVVPAQRIRIPDSVFVGLSELAERSRRSGPVLARIGALVPGCRTTAIAKLATRLMTQTLPPADAFRDDDVRYIRPGPLAFLETADPEGFVRMLRAWVTSDDEALRAEALRLLLIVGDRASADALVEYVAHLTDDARGELRALNDRSGEVPEILLARSGGPVIEKWLRENDHWMALAVLHGLPQEVARALRDSESSVESAIRPAARAGKPLDGLADFLARNPDEPHWNIWRADTPAVRAYLKRLQRRRDLGLRAWATGQLAAMGDEAARAETWEVMTTGRYRAVDEADLEAMTLGHDFTTIPFWLDELESNCCRYNVIGQVFEDLFGVDPNRYRRGYAMTSAAIVREWWEGTRGRFVFSRIAGHWVVQAD